MARVSDAPCVEGAACMLSCLAGTMTCGATPTCVTTGQPAMGGSCAAGICDGDGLCIGSEAAVLVSRTPQVNSAFGHAVSLDGNRLVISAPFEDAGGRSDAGAVYLWERAGSGWFEAARVAASDPANGDDFGSAVALQGDRLLVAAQNRATPAVYAFERIGGVWTQTDLITITGVTWLGTALAMDGERAVIGAQYNEIVAAEGTRYGTAHVIERQGDGTWTVVATLSSVGGSHFGHAVDLEGERVAVGSLWDHDAAGDESGSVRVFDRQGDGTWLETATLFAPLDTATTSFGAVGASVAIDGRRVVAGSMSASLWPSLGAAGAVLAFDQDPITGGWSMRDGWVVDAETNEQIGRSVAAGGGRAITASPKYELDQGRLSVFRDVGGAWREVARLVTPQAASNVTGVWNSVAGDLATAMSGDVAVVGYRGLDSVGAVVVYDLSGL